MTRMKWLGMVLMCGAIVGCGSDDAESFATARANIAPTATNTVTGSAVFTLDGEHVMVNISVTNAPEGMHGFHIHQNGACTMDGMDAGAHWDGMAAAGDMTGHGLPDGTTHHLGDLGNITIAADGTGTLMGEFHGMTLGDGALTDIVGHAVIFHANMDDGTMPSAGGRIGCGVIAKDPDPQ